ncbi:RNA-directed DNA polymerase, eukaryota, reverse transcriptase zinc-binding domain protein [Tanacetum coccineum]
MMSENREERNHMIVWKTDRVYGRKRIERNCELKIEREMWDKNRQSDKVSKRIERYGRKTEKRGIEKTDRVNGSLCSQSDKQKEVKKLIMEEKLQLCAVLETHDCINKVELVDLHSAGFQFTWTKSLRNPKCKTLKKLDRIMVNEEFVDKFQQAHGLFLPYLISDHSPIIVKIPDGVQKRKSSFRFSNFITEKKVFLPTVRGVWNKRIERHAMYRVVQKMKLLKRMLKKMSWENGNVFERAENLRNKVKECQAEVDKFPHDDSIKEKSWSTLREYQEATKEEYSLLCQKAKVEWLREGDRNTVYFHKTIKEIVHRSIIKTIRNEDGQRRDVQSLASRHDIFKNKINTEDAQRMVRNISDSEIKNAMFEIEDSKASGPDGYTARFYKSAWSIVGSEVCQAIKDFSLMGRFLVSKILTTRIKGVLGKLVGENQSAFIEGRQITDNILLSQELFRGYNRKHNIKKVSFKIDLQKAYDTISWDFLKEILVMFGFHEKMVSWIMTCITSAKFSINVNGERVGYFKGGRGLRQGDPISPYLFTLVMEVLNLLIQKNIQDGNGFKYHFGCKNLRITHLWFADDLLVFCHGDIESVRTMKKSLDEFSSVSGLLPNMQKSTIFFGGLSSIEQQSILNIIPFSVGKLPVRYLGVPLLTKKISMNDCKPLINKVKTKVNDWKNKALSYAGRVQLIAAVLNSMQNYWASVFLLPKHVIYEINKILKRISMVSICEYSKEIWKELKSLLSVRLSDNGYQIISEVVLLPLNRNIWSIARRIILNAAVYYIWQERNNRIFKQEKRDTETMANLIRETAMMKLIGLKVKDSATVNEVERRWQIQMKKV